MALQTWQRLFPVLVLQHGRVCGIFEHNFVARHGPAFHAQALHVGFDGHHVGRHYGHGSYFQNLHVGFHATERRPSGSLCDLLFLLHTLRLMANLL